jgi:hypothetical protein
VPPYIADHFVRGQPFVVTGKRYQPDRSCIGTQVIDGKAFTDVLARSAGKAAAGWITMSGRKTSQTIKPESRLRGEEQLLKGLVLYAVASNKLTNERQARRSVVDAWPGEQVGAEF